MILVVVVAESRREPAITATHHALKLISRDADLDRTSEDGRAQDRVISPVDRIVGAVFVSHAIDGDPDRDHGVHHIRQVRPVQEPILPRPLNEYVVRNEQFREAGHDAPHGLRRRLLGGHTVAIRVIAPHLEHWRNDSERRRDIGPDDVRTSSGKLVPW